MIIRQETPEDYYEVYKLVNEAFKTTSFSDGSEPDYLDDLRNKNTFIPELSLVAVSDEEKILGQIVLSKTSISMADNEITELLLSPICVHPGHFKKGIATQLINKAFELAILKGFSAVFLCGDPTFYSKFGFKPTFGFNIFHINDKDKNADWCMVKELKNNFLDTISGTIDIV